MASRWESAALRPFRALFTVGTLGGLTDEQLLRRFATDCGEAGEQAFAVLVERHGPMILRVCRAILRDEHEAQDAFQATFLTLVRRHNALWVGESLGPWLYGVAQRIAGSARSAQARRRRHEHRAAELAIGRLVVTVEQPDPDVERSVHEEIGKLPQRYKDPIVLCLLEGLTHQQAATHLGWPVGTVKSRLALGRERLRSRLARRGLAPAGVLSAALLRSTASRAAVPPGLAAAVTQAAVRAATSPTVVGVVPASVRWLAIGFWRSRLMRFSVAVLVFGVIAALGFSPEAPRDRSIAGLEYRFVDLQPRGNHRLIDSLSDLEGNNLAALPQGVQHLASTPFRIGERLLQVRGKLLPNAAAAVEGIAVHAKLDRLHILQGTMFGPSFGTAEGSEIGAYVVHYADQTEERIPIVYGRDVRDWWRDSDPAETSRGRVAWVGHNAATGDEGELLLYSTAWRNPHPDKRIATIDFESRDTPCVPFLIALTLERILYSSDAAAAE